MAGTCRIAGCGRKIANKKRGLCHAHEMRVARGALRPDRPIRAYQRERRCNECGARVGRGGGHGRCSKHLHLWRKAQSGAGATRDAGATIGGAPVVAPEAVA